MTYNLLFLPEVEEDVIAGYVWYEGKSRDSARNSFGYFMPALVSFLEIHCFTQRFIMNSGVVYLGDFRMLFISW